MTQPKIEYHLKSFPPGFLNLPWDLPLQSWEVPELIEVEKGLHRHVVIFVELDDIYVLKELPGNLSKKEYVNLLTLHGMGLPAVEAVGYIRVKEPKEDRSIIITRYLEQSIPYRSLFMRHGLSRYQNRLLDALAILLVNLHLKGFFWGDCSLSNVLFRRDAGELQAYLVDAETSECHSTISDSMRDYELEIMKTNIFGDLMDLSQIVDLPKSLDIYTIGDDIISRYHNLWVKINQEVVIDSKKRYEVQDYINSLNKLGFSVDEIEMVTTDEGDKLKLRTIVTDRNYHRHLLHSLTGIIAHERQAQILINDIREYSAWLSQEQDRSISLHVAAHNWLSKVYTPTIQKIMPYVSKHLTPAEAYCQVLENKWFLSEKKEKDVGIKKAIKNYLHEIQEHDIL